MKRYASYMLLSMVAFVGSCTYRANDPSVCYQDTILPILASNCGGCHAELMNYEGTMRHVVRYYPNLSDLYTSVKGSHPSMPPRNKLTSQQVYDIKAWISMGARNNSCTVCDTSQYKYRHDIAPIINNWCVSCHGPSNAGGGYDLSSYSGLSAAASNGRLLGTIEHKAGYSPMPQNGQLSSCDITRIQRWVSNGFPDN